MSGISLPIYAVVSDSEGQFVWVVDMNSMTVSKRVIKVGLGVGEMISVESGLKEGDTIVGAGAAYLTAGMKIRRLAD